jgi:hypothetical protein
MKLHVVGIGTALALIAGTTIAPAQTPASTSVDERVSAAKSAAGLD